MCLYKCLRSENVVFIFESISFDSNNCKCGPSFHNYQKLSFFIPRRIATCWLIVEIFLILCLAWKNGEVIMSHCYWPHSLLNTFFQHIPRSKKACTSQTSIPFPKTLSVQPKPHQIILADDMIFFLTNLNFGNVSITTAKSSNLNCPNRAAETMKGFRNFSNFTLIWGLGGCIQPIFQGRS